MTKSGGTFCTMPAIRNIPRNLICEVIGTFVLVFVILCLAIDGNTPEVGLGSVGLFPVTFLIVAIGMSFLTSSTCHPKIIFK